MIQGGDGHLFYLTMLEEAPNRRHLLRLMRIFRLRLELTTFRITVACDNHITTIVASVHDF